MLTNVEKRDIISMVTALAVTQRIPRSAVTFSIKFEEVEIFSFSFLDNEGGDTYVYDLGDVLPILHCYHCNCWSYS